MPIETKDIIIVGLVAGIGIGLYFWLKKEPPIPEEVAAKIDDFNLTT